MGRRGALRANSSISTRRTDGKLTLDGSSAVEAVGTIVAYKDSVFVLNENSCEKVTFAK